MDKNRLSFTILIIISLFTACTNIKNESGQLPEQADPIAESLLENEIVAYTLPSPFQVSTLVKLLDIQYSNNVVREVNNNKAYTSDNYRALNLGINIVDFGYVTIYDKYQPAILYMRNIEKLMHELGLQSEEDKYIIKSFENNFGDKDSLKQIIKRHQNKIEYYFSVIKERKIGLLILSGFYVEGLYLSSNIYNEKFKDRTLSVFMKKNMNQLFLQQHIFLSNLIDLLEIYGDEELDGLIDRFVLLNDQFNSMQINYKQDPLSGKISKVKLKTKKLEDINVLVSDIRQKIINETI